MTSRPERSVDEELHAANGELLPIVGDARYGSRGPRMMLHALRLDVPHPIESRTLHLEARAPREFRLR